MALLWIEGHEASSSQGDYVGRYPDPGSYTNAGTTTYSTPGRRGGRALTLQTASSTIKQLTPGDKRIIIGFAVRFATATACVIMRVYDPSVTLAVTHLEVALLGTGGLEVRRGQAGTVLATAPAGTINYLTGYYFLELNAYIDDAIGSVDLRVNTTSVASASGVDTRNAGVDGWGGYGMIGGGTNNNMTYDDLYVCDGTGTFNNTFLGDCRVDPLVPTGNGTTSMSTPSTGTDRGLTVDEVPPNGDTDYNTLTNVGDYDTLTLANCPNVGFTPFGIDLSVFAKKTDAGVCSLAAVVRHGGTDYVRPAVGLDVNYKYLPVAVFDKDPTGSAWTESAVNALEVGYKRTA